MKKVGILYDNISGNTGDQAIGISLRKILTQIGVEFEELIPGRFNSNDYRTIVIGGGYLLQPGPNFFYDKFRVAGTHILNSCGIFGSPMDLNYLNSYSYISVRSEGDKRKLSYLNKEVKVVPCTAMLLDEANDLSIKVSRPSIGIHLWEGIIDEEQLIKYLSSLPFHIYFLPITHYNNDFSYLAKLNTRVKNSTLIPILGPQEIFTFIGKLDYFVTASLHGAIFSYVHNVPFILYDSQEKQRFFMKDRKLESFLFKNYEELKSTFESFQNYIPDYSNNLVNDFKVLKEHQETIKDILRSNPFVSPIRLEAKDIDLKAKIQERNFQIQYLQKQIVAINTQDKILQTALEEKIKQISDLNTSIITSANQTKDLINVISEKNTQIELQIARLQNKDDQIESLDTNLKMKSDQISELIHSVQDKDSLINNLKGIIEVNNKRVNDLTQQSEALTEELLYKKTNHLIEINNKNQQISELGNVLQQKDIIINSLDADLRNKESQINLLQFQMQQSITLKLQARYQRMMERLLGHGTRRRHYYELALTGVRVILDEGWQSFFKKTKNWLRMRRSVTNRQTKSLPVYQSSISSPTAFLKKLAFPIQSEKPEVSIVIPVYNKLEYTLNCLNSICEYTEGNYEVIVVDDCSTDETPRILSKVKNIRFIRNNKNSGFIDSCNHGAETSRGNHILFLNNDTLVTENWLPPLLETLIKEDVGAAGSKFIYPDNVLQEAGSIVWNDGSALGYGRGDNSDKPEYNYVREVDYCSGACLVAKRELFEKIGGFDQRFKPGYYEDTDLCFSIRDLGYKVIYQPNSVIIHFEGITCGTEVASGVKKYQEINKPKFYEKWKDTLEKYHYPPIFSNVISARNKASGKSILVLDDRIPNPSHGSGFPRAYHMLKLITELGYKVTFFPLDNKTPWQPYTNELQQLGIEVFYGNNIDFNNFCEERKGYYELILISRPHNMKNNFITIKKYFPNSFLFYDAEALFSLREMLKAQVKGIELNKIDSEKLINEEINLIQRADYVITVSDNEKNFIQERTKLANIGVWGHAVQVSKPSTSFSDRKDILFVGGFLGLDSPNEDAILYFAKEVFPEIAKKLLCTLFVVGINPPDSVKKIALNSITVTGFVENIKDYYDKCRIFIVPHRYSAGIPLKLLEAMSYGIPSVVSKLTAKQLNLTDGKEVLIADSSEEYFQKITSLYQNESLWEQLSLNGLEFVKANYSSDILKLKLRDILKRAS
jgi:O-antigen biosynthesis protein